MFSWPMIIGICHIFVCIASTAAIDNLTALEEFDDENFSEADFPKPLTLDDLCLTPACIDTASKILKSMNLKINPCDNFYDFVCGNYGKTVALSDSHLYSIPIHASMLEVDLRQQSIIEDINPSSAPEPFLHLRISYDNCMREKWKDNVELNQQIEHKYTQMSHIWQSLSIFEWKDSMFERFPVVPYILNFEDLTVLNTQFMILKIKRRKGPVAYSYLREGMSNEVVRNYTIFMQEVVKYLGAASCQVAVDVPNIVSMEVEISQILFPLSKSQNDQPRFRWTTVKDLDEMYPKLGLRKLTTAADDVPVKLNMDDEVIRQLNSWMHRKTKRDLASWSAWQRTVGALDELGPYAVRKKNSLLRTIYGFIKREPKWRQCVKRVRSRFSFLVDVLYYGQHLSASVVRDSIEVFHNIKQQFIEFIQKADWLSENTKRDAIEKVSNIKHNLGVYEKFMLNKTSDPSYVDLKLSNGVLSENRGNLTKISEYALRLLSTTKTDIGKYDFVRWQSQYVGGPNFLRIGALGYTDNFYNEDRLDALNYAGFGFWVGHELAHSLDDQERHFDAKNSKRRWWDRQSNKIYRQRIQCLTQQYKEYARKEFGLKVKVSNTRNEDIADNVGTKVVYFAYDTLTKGKLPERQLPGLNYSAKQMFWIGLASNWCSKYRPETERAIIYEDNHSMERFRINVPLLNIQGFADDFKCDPGTKMNPMKKCIVW